MRIRIVSWIAGTASPNCSTLVAFLCGRQVWLKQRLRSDQAAHRFPGGDYSAAPIGTVNQKYISIDLVLISGAFTEELRLARGPYV